MTELTKAQRITLIQMRGYRVIAQLHTQAIIVVFGANFRDAMAVDADGNVCSLARYFSHLELAH